MGAVYTRRRNVKRFAQKWISYCIRPAPAAAGEPVEITYSSQTCTFERLAQKSWYSWGKWKIRRSLAPEVRCFGLLEFSSLLTSEVQLVALTGIEPVFED